MSNQDLYLNDLMPADEQEAIFRDALVSHHHAFIEQISAHIEMVKASGAMTPEAVAVFEDVLDAQRQWMASHGIYFQTTGNEVEDNE